MRVYFIFKIKDEFKEMYSGREINLYQVLRSIYHLDKSEVEYGYSLLRQIIEPIDKEVLDRNIFIKLHQDYPYSKRNGIHYYNLLYKDEVSRLKVNKNFIKVEVDNKYCSFFSILSEFENNLFACDFNRLNYFFI